MLVEDKPMSGTQTFEIRRSGDGFQVLANFGSGSGLRRTVETPSEQSAITWAAGQYSVPVNAWVRAPDGSLRATR